MTPAVAVSARAPKEAGSVMHSRTARKRGAALRATWTNGGLRVGAAQPTEFERMVAKLGLAPEEMVHSRQLRRWARLHKNLRYVPEELLKAWDLQPHFDF